MRFLESVRRFGAAVVPLAMMTLATATPAVGSILTFDQTRATAAGPVVPTFGGASVPEGYGDRITGAEVAVAGGVFTYGEAGEGFTPNVVADFFSGGATPAGPAVSLWDDGYGDLVNVLFGNNFSQMLNMTLTADPGFEVLLYGFDLAGWPQTDYVVEAVRVFGDTVLLFEQTSVLVEGDVTGPRHTPFSFAVPLTAGMLSIEIAYGNLPGSQHDNIGIDNIRFGQTPPPSTGNGPPTGVPEPGVLALVAVGAVAQWCRRRRGPVL